MELTGSIGTMQIDYSTAKMLSESIEVGMMLVSTDSSGAPISMMVGLRHMFFQAVDSPSLDEG